MEIEVVNYIKEAQKHGLSEQEIKKNLLNAGWDAGAVEASFEHIKAMPHQLAANKDEDISRPRLAETVKPQSQSATQSASLSEKQAKPEPKGAFQAPGAVSEKSFGQSGQLKSFFARPIFLGPLAALIILGAGGYFYYTLVYAKNQPQKIWDKFIQSPKSQIYQNNFKVRYFDTGSYEDEKAGGFKLKDIKLEFEGKAYLDASEPKNPTSSSEISYAFSSGNTSIKTGFGYRLLNKVLYVKVGGNPFLDAFFNSMHKGKQIEWLSFDLNQLEKELGQTPGADAEKLKRIFNADFEAELQKLWTDAKLIKIKKVLGEKTLNGIKVIHFQNELDKQALKTLLETYLNKIFTAFMQIQTGGEEKNPEDILATAKAVISGLMDKIEIRELETWIGKKDYKLYKVHLVSNAPSVINSMQNFLGEARSKSRDALRMSDIRQIASALELYYNDFGGYPDAQNGVPIGLAPTYIYNFPQAPTPADGGCSEYYNGYWYSPNGQKSKISGKTVFSAYEITFCLGQQTGGIEAGIAKLTPIGIQGNIACPSEPEKCGAFAQPKAVSQPAVKTDEEKIKEILSKVVFSAEFKMDSVYADYGKKIQVEPPESFTDILELFKGGVLGAFINQSSGVKK